VAVAVQGESNAQSLPPRIALHPASAVDETAVAHLPADLRCRILRSFVGRALIARVDANAMLANPHSRFLGRCRCAHRNRRPRRPGTAVALLRSPTLCHGPDGAQIEPVDRHPVAQTAPDYEVDRHINW